MASCSGIVKATCNYFMHIIDFYKADKLVNACIMNVAISADANVNELKNIYNNTQEP